MDDEPPAEWRGLVAAIVGLVCLIYLPAALVGALIGVIITNEAGVWNVVPAAIAVVIAHQWAARKN